MDSAQIHARRMLGGTTVTEANSGQAGRPPKLWIQEAVTEGICRYCNQIVTTKNTTRIKKVITSFIMHALCVNINKIVNEFIVVYSNNSIVPMQHLLNPSSCTYLSSSGAANNPDPVNGYIPIFLTFKFKLSLFSQ